MNINVEAVEFEVEIDILWFLERSRILYYALDSISSSKQIHKSQEMKHP